MPLPSSDGPIDGAAVREALARILASTGFAGSLRLRRFLRYVVEQQLAGESAQLKEYAVGVEVFDRQGDYDPRLDSIVRVEAGRLRSKIDEYYAGEGAADAVRISLPRGSYVPVFEQKVTEAVGALPGYPDSKAEGGSKDPPLRVWARRPLVLTLVCASVLIVAVLAGWRSLAESSGARAAAPGVSIAVLPFEEYSASESDVRLADQLTGEVTTALARLGKFSVVSRTSARQFQGARKPMHEIAEALGARVIMEAAVELDGDGLFIQPRLVDATIDRKFWVGEFRGTRADLRDLATRMAAEVTDAVLAREAKRQD